MPDAPDFNQIARDCIEAMRLTGADMDTDTADGVAEQLRLIWNARGTADIALVEREYDPEATTTEDLIRKLDR